MKEVSVSLDIINTLGPTSAIVLAVIQQNKIPSENFDELISNLENYLKFENRENLIQATQKLLKLKQELKEIKFYRPHQKLYLDTPFLSLGSSTFCL